MSDHMKQVRTEIKYHDSVLATPLQQGMIFHNLREPGSGVDVEQITVRSDSRLNRERLAAAFKAMLLENEILRACFDWESKALPQLRIVDDVSLVIAEEFAGSESELNVLLFSHLKSERSRGFELDKAPLMRASLFHANSGSVLVWTFHHSLLDGRSFPPLLEELFLRYDDAEIAHLVRPRFTEYAQWLSEYDFRGDLRYWDHYLTEVQAPSIFPTLTSVKGVSTYGFFEQRLDAAETACISKQCKRVGISLNTMLQAAWGVLLHQYQDTQEVVFGATYTTRHCEFTGVEEMMGLLINTLPVRIDFSSQESGAELLMQLSEHAKAVRPHVLTPLNLIQQKVGLSGDLQLFDTVVVFDRLDVDAALHQRQPGWDNLRCQYMGQTNFALALVAYGGESLCLRLEYDHKRIDDEHGKAILAAYRSLLRQFSINAETVAAGMSMLSDEERQRKTTPNITPNNKGECLHEIFRRVAAKYPDKIALRCGDKSLTYEALDLRSDLVASALINSGVKAEEKIGLCMERSNDMIVGVLGILKSGCAYVPVDPAYPDTRIQFTLDDAGIKHIVTDVETRGRLQDFDRSLLIESLLEAEDEFDANKLRDNVTDKNLAYVIYTSGSTGTPKGVAVTHRNVSRLMSSTQHWFDFGPEDKWTLFHSIAFDWTVFEIWGALTYGGELNVVPYWISRSPTDFYRLLSESGITVLCQTPSAFLNLQVADEELHEKYPICLNFVIFGGEALELPSLAQWVSRYGDAIPKLINMYGITETTVHVTYRRISRIDVESGSGSVIGEPIPDLDILLLNRHGEPVPPGVVAEIYVAGEGLARGYLNQPKLTKERFREDLKGGLKGIRLYRSGDLARWLPNGDLVYCGRADFQVKIRGYRIELGEIENVIASIAGVQQAVVIAIKGPSGANRLVAYYVSSLVPPTAVSEAAAGLLPAHMLPGDIIQLSSLPLTQNGKVDLQQLPDPEFSESLSTYRKPESLLEHQLAEIWQEILGLENIGVDDNFFERGGDSILSIQLISHARKAGIALTAREIYQNPTIAAMAQLANEQAYSSHIERSASVDRGVPMLPVQRWFVDSISQVNHWNQSFTFSVRRPIKANLLRQALEVIVQRHPILGARFETDGTTWSQRLADSPNVFVRESEDAGNSTDRVNQLENFAFKINKRVDLGGGKNVCAGLLNFADGTQVLCIAIHHLVIDGITWSIIVRELDEILDTTEDECRVIDAQTTPEYVFAEWGQHLFNNKSDFFNEKVYWEKRGLGLDGGSDVAVDYRQSASFHLSEEFDPGTWPDSSGVSRQDIVVAAFAGALASVFEQTQGRVDLESHGRNHEVSALDFSNAAGWYTSIFPFCVTIPENNEILDLLEAVHRELRGIPKDGIGYGVLQSCGELRSQGFAEHLFNFMGNFSRLFSNCKNLELHTPIYKTWRSETAAHSHPCEWIVATDENNIHIDVLYDPTRFPFETIERITGEFLQRVELTNGLVRKLDISSDKLLVSISDWEQARSVAKTATRILPTTPIQDLYLSGRRGNLDIGIEQWYLKLEGVLDASALRRAWEETLQDHTGLCTTFPRSSRGEILQAFHANANMEWQELAIDHVDELADIRDREQSRRLDVASGPLHRLLLVHAGELTHYLIWTHHHVHIDGWSWPIVLNHVHGRYRQFVNEQRDVVNFASSDYSGYVEWISRSRPKIDIEFWRTYLNEIDSDGRLPDEKIGLVGVSTCSEILDRQLSDQISKTAVNEGVTISSMFHAAWAYALAGLLNKRSICIGSTFSGRSTVDVDFTEVVGPFVTNLPIRVEIDSRKLDALHRNVHETMVEFQDRQFHSPAEIQEASGIPWVTPMFESLVVFQNYQINDLTFNLGSEVEVTEVFTPVRTNFPVTIVVIPGAKIQLDFIFDSARISAQFVEDAVLLVRSYLTAVVEGKQLELTSRFDYSRFLNPECQVKPVGKAPDSEHEQSLVEIWRELFGDPRIGVTDNFFDLGGRSIMLPVLMSRIKARTGAVVPFVALFQDPTVRGLARHLESAPESSNRLVERGRLRADRSKSALRRASEKRARRGKNNA
jgi:amino acid adenylation domain-containing protein